jgi:hypothetical protein
VSSFRLPPSVDDRAVAVANNFEIKFPGLKKRERERERERFQSLESEGDTYRVAQISTEVLLLDAPLALNFTSGLMGSPTLPNSRRDSRDDDS